MAAPVNANINVLVNTQQAMAQLRALQGQVTTLNSSLSATSGTAAAQQAALAKGLKDSANASRMWQARIVPMNTATQQFSDALDKGRMSLGQYTRYAASQLPGMSRVFKREFEMMNRVATQNVKQMQTQYVTLGQSATGAAQAMALTPTALNKHAAASAIAAQRQMMMNRMIDLGTTKLLNWGKNTQWAGRQLMVGFSIPLAMVGAVAAKAFKEIDKGSIAFKRVYGDLSTTTAEMERNLQAVKDLGNEYTKYGLKLADTIELAADVAATGAKNESLLAATEQTLRLSTLGLMEYGEALEATVALQTAFQVSNEDLASTIDFLNVVENETILTMQDMAAAIPRVAPVVKGLGGDVRDLAVFMTAMREGGVTAEQGANALKSGLGRLINPTKAAREVMEGFGLSIDAIIQSNRGDLMGMMQDFGNALATLGDFEQQQVLEKVFGKYQYARLGALFKNLANDASQANRTIELTNMSMEDLASISERELSKIEEATSTKFQASVERLQVAIAPVGEQFMKALMPVIDFVTKIIDRFNDLPDNIKNAIAIGVAAIAGIGPIVLMTVGLIANGIANIGKLIQTMRKFFARLRGDSALFNYLTQEEREAATAANALSGATDNLTGKFLGQRRALESLVTMVGRYAGALSSAAAAAPIAFGMGSAAAVAGAAKSSTARGTTITGPQSQTKISGFQDGIVMVPGSGSGDKIPALLEPGESVITKDATQKYGAILSAMNAGTLPGFDSGVVNIAGREVEVRTPKDLPVSQIQAKADAAVQALLNAGETIENASARVASALESTIQSLGTTKTGQQKVLYGGKADEAFAEFMPRTERMAAAHLTGAIPSSDPRVQARLAQGDPAAFGKRMTEALFPGSVSGTTQFTMGTTQSQNIRMRPGGSGITVEELMSIDNNGLLPSLSRQDAGILDDSEAIQASQELAQRIKERAAQIAAGTEDGRVRDEQLDQAQQEVLAEYQEERQNLSAGQQRVLSAAETARESLGEVRANVGQEALDEALSRGTVTRTEGGQIIPNLQNAETIQQLKNAGFTDEDIFNIASDIESGRIDPYAASRTGSEGERRPGSPIKSGQVDGVQMGRPEAELSSAQEARVRQAMSDMDEITQDVVEDVSSQTQQAMQGAYADGANEAIDAQSPAGEGVRSVDMYAEGMEIGTQQNLPEIEQQGRMAGETYDQAVKNAIRDGGDVPPLPPSQAPPADAPRPDGFAAANAAAVTAEIMEAEAITPMKQQMGRVKDAARTTVAEIRRSLSESAKAFREIPNFAKTSLYQIKEAFKSMGPMIKQIAGPYVKPIINAFNFVKDTIVTNVKGVAGIVKDGLINAATSVKNAALTAAQKAKGAYEMAAVRTLEIMDSIKRIPNKIKGAYEMAAVRTLEALDSIKNFPQKVRQKVQEVGQNVRNRVQDLRENLGPQARRLANQAFYRGQDALGKIRERFSGLRERVSSGTGASAAALREGAVSSATRALIPDKTFAKIEGTAQKLQSAAESARKFIADVPKQIVDAAKNFSQSVARVGTDLAKRVQVAADTVKARVSEAGNAIKARVLESATSFKNAAVAAGFALREGSIGSAVRALTPDALAAKINSAVTALSNAGKFVGEKITAAGARLAKTGQTLATSLRAAGFALREGSMRDAVRALTPDKLRASIGSMVTTLKTVPDIIRVNTRAAFEVGKAAIINGFNNAKTAITNAAILAKDTIVINTKAALEIAKGAILNTANNIKQTVKTALNTAKTTLKAEFDRVSGIIRTEGPKVAQAFRNAATGIVSAGASARTEMGKAFKNVGTSVVNAGKGAATLVKESGKLLGMAIKGVAAQTQGFLGQTDSQGRTRGQRIASGGNTAMMGLMGVSMAASMAGGELGEMAQKIMPVTMGLMGLQMILPMLTNPFGLATLAIAGLAAAAVYGQGQIRKLAKNAADVGAGLGGVTNGLKVMEEALGFTAPDNKDRLFRFSDEDRAAMSEFSGFFEGESGQNFIQELRESTSEERYQKVANMLAQGIASGADPEQAEQFGKAIANELGDALLNSNIARDFAKGVFNEGSQALIDLEKRRIREFAPGRVLSSDITSISGQTVGSMGGVGDVLDSIASVIPGVTTINEVAAEIGGEGIGFAVKSLENLRNAEAVLTEERRNGLISAEEYGQRLEEINLLQSGATYAIRDAINLLGAKAPNIRPVFEERLKAAGFDDQRIGEVLSQIAPEDLSVKIFDKAFKDLDWAQQNFISEVFARTISGLTPENYGDRFADIEDTWKVISEDAVEAIREGALGAEGSSVAGVNIQDMFNQQELQDWLKYNFGDALEAQGITAQAGAQNIMAAGQGLTEIGTDFFEVQAALQRFTDPSNVANIVKSKDEIVRLGEALVGLSDFPKINIELFIQDPEFDPEQLKSELEKIGQIKFDKETFGEDFAGIRTAVMSAMPDPQEWANVMEGMGVPVEKFYDKYKGAAKEVGQAIVDVPGKTKEAFDEAGNLRPKIALDVITNLLGGVVDNPEAMANRITNSIPELNPLQLMIMVSLGGEGAALLADPNFKKAVEAGENIAVTDYVGGAAGVATRTTQYTQQQLDMGSLFFGAGGFGPSGTVPEDKPEDTSGGSSKEKTFMEQTMEDLEANSRLYLTTQRAAKKYGKNKANFFGVFQELRRKFDVPEGFIASLGTGAEAVAKAAEFMKATKKERKRLLELYKETSVGEQIERLRRDREERRTRTKSIEILAANGIDLEDAKKAAEDSELAIAIVEAAAKGNKKKLNRLLGLIKTEVIAEEEDTEDPLDALSKRISQINDLMGQAFDAAEIEAADGVAKKFFDDNTTLAQKLAKSTGHTIENGYQLAEAMERQVSLNERLINQEQEKIDAKQEEISDYERSNQLIQQGIDDLKREDEIRNRRSEGLSRDLEQIAKAEEEIRKSYQDRIDALDKVAKVNEHLIQQQQKQLNLSRAISEGDIYAATQAAQEMRAASAQQAVEQRRLALEQGMEGAIAGLTSAEGMTRAEIEEEINNIKEQNYQNSLLIRIEEDKIYANSLEIRRLSNEIYDIQENLIEPLENQNKEYSRMLDYYKEDADYQISRVTLAGMTREQFEKQADALGLAIKNAQDLDPELKALVGDYNAIATAANAAAAAAAKLGVKMATSQFSGQVTGTPSAAPAGGSVDLSGLTADMFGGIDFSNLDLGGLNLGLSFNNAGGLIKKYAQGGMVNPLKYTSNEPPPAQKRASGGMVFGEGARDSVAAMLTPGEFVIRKAMVDKYGLPLMKALNQGSFAMPTYETGMQTPEMGVVANNMVSNINAPVYNTYDMKFSISGTNQSADEIANKVMFKMQQIQNQGIRSNRGY